MNPCYPDRGKHDFESCAFDRSAISASSIYYTSLLELCQSFGQVFYRESGQNADNNAGGDADGAYGGQLDEQRRRFHDRRGDARAGDIADDGAGDADG